jgi:cellulose synthase/poly-beta-1,6-N-acetylglucosamine synthase-like glycosyltransferase
MPVKEKIKFSIVIPCRNEKDYISNCVKSIEKQDYNSELIEIVIVDGFSEDGTKDILETLKKNNDNIKVLDNPSRKTPQALNIGIKNSSGDAIIILGAHTELDKDFVKYNNKFLNEKKVKVTGGTQINVGHTYAQNLIGIVMEMPFAMASAKYRWSDNEQYVDTVVYAAYRKELFDEVGYFEEGFTISEDAEFNWRIRQAGYKIFFSPKIKSYYYPRDSIIGFIKQIFRYGILRVNVLKKHIDSFKFLHLIPPAFVLVLVFGVLLGFINKVFFTILGLLLAFYFILNISASIKAVFPNKIKYFLFIPFLVFILHISWGLGFLVGMFLPKSQKY